MQQATYECMKLDFFSKIKQLVVKILENINKQLKFRTKLSYHTSNSHKPKLETIHNISFYVGVIMGVCPPKVVQVNIQVCKAFFIIVVWETHIETDIKQHNYGFWFVCNKNGIHMLYSEGKYSLFSRICVSVMIYSMDCLSYMYGFD